MMNTQQLADLIFPDTKDISYYEEKYPQRTLSVRTVYCRDFAYKTNRRRIDLKDRRYRPEAENRKWRTGHRGFPE